MIQHCNIKTFKIPEIKELTSTYNKSFATISKAIISYSKIFNINSYVAKTLTWNWPSNCAKLRQHTSSYLQSCSSRH